MFRVNRKYLLLLKFRCDASFLSILFIACQRDSCELFCEELGRDIRYCINNGSLEWQDFEATSENDFSQIVWMSGH